MIDNSGFLNGGFGVGVGKVLDYDNGTGLGYNFSLYRIEFGYGDNFEVLK